MDAKWHWYRYEYALQRGSIHCHGVAKLNNDPDVCKLIKLTLDGYLSSKKLIDRNYISESEQLELQRLVLAGKDAKQKVCDYVDSILSTHNNPNPPDLGMWQKLIIYPCQRNYDENSTADWDEDYENLLNKAFRLQFTLLLETKQQLSIL